MLVSTPTADYVALRPSKRDVSLSPSYRAALHHQTPPRFASGSSGYCSPMLTPSPLKRTAVPEPMDEDDVFSSPKASSYTLVPQQERATRPRSQAVFMDDEDELFLGSSSSNSRALFPPTSSPMPLRTPVKQPHRVQATPERLVLSAKYLSGAITGPPALSAGTKRKPTPNPCTTPQPRHMLTPLNVTASAATQRGGDSDSFSFDRLAPLPAPRFGLRTPVTKAETDLHLKRQAESMTKLKIRDMDQSGDESGYDSASGNEAAEQLFLGGSVPGTTRGKAKSRAFSKSPGLEALIRQGRVNEDEVAEAVSPGGHISKRRARSRPLSSELLDSAQNTPSVAEKHVKENSGAAGIHSPDSVTFPSFSYRSRRASNSSSTSSDAGSPRRRGVTNSGIGPRVRTQSHSTHQRAPLTRLTSSSSATLFFGPAIPQSAPVDVPRRANPASGNLDVPMISPTRPTARSKAPVRHSGPQSHSVSPSWTWNGAAALPSTHSSPRSRSEDEEADFFFGGPADSSFSFSVTENTPSPKKKQRMDSGESAIEMLPKKFRPRDSGIMLDESDDDAGLGEGPGAFLSASLPRASTSVSTIQSDSDGEPLVTPGFGPGDASGWPTVGIVNLDDEPFPGSSHNLGVDRRIDAFILRTLAAGAKPSAQGHGEPKRVPGTPVKKVKTANLLVERPWQSAVTTKIGFPEFDAAPGTREGGGKAKGKPRKSLPAAFPMGARSERPRRDALTFNGSLSLDGENENDDEEASPTMRKDVRYNGLGLGRPPVPIPAFARVSGDNKNGKPHWLMRRSSSGAFSNGSDASAPLSTPTKFPNKDWQLPTRFSEQKQTEQSASSRSTSSSSSSTVQNSPTMAITTRHLPPTSEAPLQRLGDITNTSPKKPVFAQPAPPSAARGQNIPGSALRGRLPFVPSEEQPGRFERDFLEIDELGRGEFGRVMKARYKEGSQEVFAVKKSKRFEGVKHRLRLREEVDVLKHLSHVAGARGHGVQATPLHSQARQFVVQGRHPNVLGYVDNWEEDETLYIQTELCELGNFAHFLWEYGRAFPRLDEARVWKIFADLSSGLSFIHDAGVIHLDLKPANIFVTGSGRFKIGDFGMASIWPRPPPAGTCDKMITGQATTTTTGSSFEREGDKLYLAPEVLQGKYGKAADIFSLGMTMFETATNIVVPDQGEAWHRLRHEDFSQVDTEGISAELISLLKSMMRSDPSLRVTAGSVCGHPVLMRARTAMESSRAELGDVFAASPLAGVPADWLAMVLGSDDADDAMDVL